MLSFKVIIILILMQNSKKGPASKLLTSEDSSHPYAADQGELEPEVNMYA